MSSKFRTSARAVAYRARAFAAAPLLFACLFAAGPRAEGALVLNEVLYDPAGEDAGAEFVELWNDGEASESLEGVSIEAGDGARLGSWIAIFAGSAADSAPPHAAFLIAASRLTGAIQNGPDAIRLVRNGVVIDRLGFGALDVAEFFEGAPAADAGSGESLARRADGFDTDRNDADWEPAAPTPGAPNHPPYFIALGSASLRPEVGWQGAEGLIDVTARNRGTRALDGGAWEVALLTRPRPEGADAESSAGWSEGAAASGASLAPGESTRVRLSLTPDRTGPFDCLLVARPDPRSGDVAAAMRPDSLRVPARAGVGPVAIAEFAYRDEGAGEWVELEATEEIAAWDAFTLGDATSAPRRLVLRGGSPGARAGERRVAVSDPARFSAHFSIPESLLLVTERGWSSLNDGASSAPAISPHADVVRVTDGAGVPSDAVPYDEGWSVRGGSVERLSLQFPSAARRSWSESVAVAGGTPGAPNSIAAYRDGAPAPSMLLAAPARVLRRTGAEGVGALLLELGPAVAERTVRLSILDLRGRVRRLLAAGERFGSAGAVLWDGLDDEGRPVEPGLYVARVEAAAGDGAPRRASVAIAVAPSGAGR